MFTKDPEYKRIDEMLAQVKAAEPLPKPSGKVVKVSTAWEIIRAVEDAEENTTVVIAKGHYVMPRDFILDTNHVTIRGETGNREDVILDGNAEYDQHFKPLSTRFGAPGILKLIRCKHVMIADLTFYNSPKYGIMMIGDGRVHNLTVYNVKFHNIWARGLKGTGPYRIDHGHYTEEELGYVPKNDDHLEWNRPRHGRVQHCLFINDHPKRDLVDPDEGNYIAAMDLMALQDWAISDNLFVGIRGASGRGRGAVFIWVQSEDVVVENNVFIHCDKAMGIGNPHGSPASKNVPVGGYSAFHIKNSVIRNNTIVGGCNKGIEVQHGDNMEIYGNRICSFERKEYHAIQVLGMFNEAKVYDNTIQIDPLEAFNCCEEVNIGENTVGDLKDQFTDIEIGNLSLKEEVKK